jgi:hypothetical protein
MTPVRHAREEGLSSVAAIWLPHEVRDLLKRPTFVHLSTLRPDGSPRNHVVRVGLEDDVIAVTRAYHRTLGFTPPRTHIRNGT